MYVHRSFVAVVVIAFGQPAARAAPVSTRVHAAKPPGVTRAGTGRVRTLGYRHGAKRARRAWPPMALINPNSRHNRRLLLGLYDRRGRIRRAAVRQLSAFMRCRRTGKRHRIDTRLIQYLYRVSRHYGGREIYVYSGFRDRSVARHKHSRHIMGRAADIRVRGIGKRQLRDYLMRSFKHVGIGYYPNSRFVHFDVRKRSAFWIDRSGPGERPRYVENAYEMLASERRGARVRGAQRGTATPLTLVRAPVIEGPRPLGPPPERWVALHSARPPSGGPSSSAGRHVVTDGVPRPSD